MTDDDATIHLRVPAALKARWVLESRAAGRRLTDWIIERVEAQMHQTILMGGEETATWREARGRTRR